MNRLTEGQHAPVDKKPEKFETCWVCGKTYSDICELKMYVECDENDECEEGNCILICKSEECIRVLEEHPRLYMEIAWGGIAPGAFILLCSDCTFRDGFRCTHSDLKANGGEGLQVWSRNLFGAHVHVLYRDGRGGYIPPVVFKCDGKKVKSCRRMI